MVENWRPAFHSHLKAFLKNKKSKILVNQSSPHPLQNNKFKYKTAATTSGILEWACTQVEKQHGLMNIARGPGPKPYPNSSAFGTAFNVLSFYKKRVN